jgi:hypothetical protein
MSIDRLMNNIYTNESDYRAAPDLGFHPKDYGKLYRGGERVFPVTWYVYNPNRRVASFGSEEEAKEFIRKRCNPVEIPSKVYSDICRCGISVLEWEYFKVGELVFERCAKCKNPMRHDVMVELNKELIKDFSLEDFLGL